MRQRTFINHPKVGTVMLTKTRPRYRSKRHQILQSFVWRIAKYTPDEPFAWSHCKHCDKILLNPHSILMHIGNGCEKLKNEN